MDKDTSRIGLLSWRGIQKSEIIIYEVGSKVNRNNDKITGYHWLKRITIDVMIFLLKDVIPVFGAVITMSVVIGPTLWFATNHIILLVLLGMIALLILIVVRHLIAKKISKTAEKLYGKQDLYLIDHDLYCTEDVRTRFSHVIRCYKPIEIYHVEKTKFYWAVDCLCYKIRKSGNAREDIGLVLKQLIQDEKNLTPVKETLLFKRQYHDEIEKMIDEVLRHHKSSE